MAQSRVDLRERTKSFALRVVRMFASLPKTTEAQVLGKQVPVRIRIAEWRMRNVGSQQIAATEIEIEETAYWLELLVEANIVSAGKLAATPRSKQ